MGCGKGERLSTISSIRKEKNSLRWFVGGDQSKWHIGNVKHVTFAGEHKSHRSCCLLRHMFLVDLAENSVEECKNRYFDRQPCYQADFFPLNCTTVRSSFSISSSALCLSFRNSCEIKSNARNPVSIWSAVNSFCTTPTTKSNPPTGFCAMPRNFYVKAVILLPPPSMPVDWCTYLRRCPRESVIPSLRFLSASELCRESPNQTVSNDVFSIRFDSSIDLSSTTNEAIPLFGAKYDFSLDELVDCPEYLVYYPLLKQ